MKFQNEYVETKSLYFEKYGTPKMVIRGASIWFLAAVCSVWYSENILASLFLALAVFQCVRNTNQIGRCQKEYDKLVKRVGEGRKVKTSFFKDRVVVEAEGEGKKVYDCESLLGFKERKNVISLYFEKKENKKAKDDGENEISFLKNNNVDIVCVKKDAFTMGDLVECKEFLRSKQNADLFFA